VIRSKVTVAPTSEPITLTELKAHLRITGTAEDTLLTDYIETARIMVEDITGRKLINQTLVGYTDSFSSDNNGQVKGEWWSGVRVGTYFTHILNGKTFIELDWTPISSITSVYTVDDDASETLYASTNYYLDNFDNDMKSRIYLTENAEIPTGLRCQNAIKITYVAGYGATAASVPMSLNHAVKLMAAEIYNKRGDCEDCALNAGVLPTLQQYKIMSL